jgi:hypothetical protein
MERLVISRLILLALCFMWRMGKCEPVAEAAAAAEEEEEEE